MSLIFDFFMSQWEQDPWRVFSTALNIFLTFFMFWLGNRFVRSEARAQKAEEKTRALEQRAEQELFALRTRVDRELINWGVASIERLAQAHILIERSSLDMDVADFEFERSSIRSSLSALVDRGRLYFPNHSADIDWPSWRAKAPANRGFRDPILDAIMIAYEELSRLDVSSQGAKQPAANNVFAARRAFISELQDWIKPRTLGFGHDDAVKEPVAVTAKEDKTWEAVRTIVDDFESRYGEKSFWIERPITRKQLLAELKYASAA